MRNIVFSAVASVSLLSVPFNALGQQELEEIIVTAHPLASQGTAQAITILSGDDLDQRRQGSLGETIAGEAGINSASFGSAVGRPVIHGLAGARVKTTEDRIDSMDVSVASGDHAVTIEPFIANQINILKGASTLLYGSGAIGGVIDVETGRIPNQLPEDDFNAKVELRGMDNSNATTAAARIDGKLSNNIAYHVDLFNRDADDYDIPGFAESEAFHDAEEQHEEEHEEEHEDEHADEEHHDEHEEEEVFGVLEGSRLKNSGGAIGLSFVGDRGFAGFSVSKLDAEYGLVGGHGHEEEHGEEEHHDEEEEHEDEHEEDEHEHEDEEEGVGIIDMKQTRFDFEAQLNNPFAGFEFINFRFGLNDYEHAEIEGNGELGTLFENDAWEARILAKHNPFSGINGSLGLQLNDREFSALGEEAFVPPVSTDSIGLFWVGEKNFDSFDLEFGARYEQLEHKPTQDELSNLDFNTTSASVGIVAPINDALALSALLDFSSRAPSIEELYSNGPHLATQSFEIGDPNLQEESASAISFSAQYETRKLNFNATLYFMKFSDFIYQTNTGEELDELPVFIYEQNDAEFAGLDAKLELHLAVIANGDLDLVLLFDTVSAELTNTNTNLPRIPADRAGISLEWKSTVWDTELSYTQVSSQTDVADFELPTESYNDVSLFINRKIAFGENQLSLFLHGRNLTDDEQRNHASFVKDLAPAAGRRFEIGVRMEF